MIWNEFLTELAKGGLIKRNDDFSFSGDFGKITEFGETTEIAGFYSSYDNFFFDLIGRTNKYGNNAQTQIVSGSGDKFASDRLFIKIIFSDIEVG